MRNKWTIFGRVCLVFQLFQPNLKLLVELFGFLYLYIQLNLVDFSKLYATIFWRLSDRITNNSTEKSTANEYKRADNNIILLVLESEGQWVQSGWQQRNWLWSESQRRTCLECCRLREEYTCLQLSRQIMSLCQRFSLEIRR